MSSSISSRLIGAIDAVLFAVVVSCASTATAQPASAPSAGRQATASPAAKTAGEQFRDRDAPPDTRYRLGPFLSFGAETDVEYRFHSNFDLDKTRRDDLAIIDPELSVAFSFDPSKHLRAFLNFELSRQFALVEKGRRTKRSTELELEEAFVLFREVTKGLSFQIGRQEFKDEREWLYDDELDALRMFYQRGAFSLELSASRRGLVNRDLLDKDENNPRINNYLAYGTYALSKDANIAAYALIQDDRSRDNESPIFIGLQSHGEVIDDLDYWIELAHVRGKDGARKLRGFGMDLGLSYHFDVRWRPSFTIGYAFGSGDRDPDDRVDTSFRQSGFQENEARFQGVTEFKYYGSLLDPELSNLHLWTIGAGVRPTRRSSIDIVYHRYVQHRASTRIRDSSLSLDPTGRSRNLGQEIDLILGYRELRDLDLKLELGYFMPGRAFPRGADAAFFTKFEIEFKF